MIEDVSEGKNSNVNSTETMNFLEFGFVVLHFVLFLVSGIRQNRA